MRKKPTPAEAAVWDLVRAGRLGSKFRRQHPIWEYVVDFVCLEKKLVIEIDSGYLQEPEQMAEDK